MTLTEGQLKVIVPYISKKNLETYIPLLNDSLEKNEINTVERLSCFIAQVAHESASFRYTREIASGEAYEGRKDLGNTEYGDGVKFKGKGLVQVTGRANYLKCSLALFGDGRLLNNPSLLEIPKHALDSAYWYWKTHDLNEVCDYPEDWRSPTKGYNKFQFLTYRINGGLNGYAERLAFYKRAKQVLIPPEAKPVEEVNETKQKTKK